MNTNQFFSLSRLWLLLRNDMMMNYKKYLLTIGGALVVCFIIIYITMPSFSYRSNYGLMMYQQQLMITLVGLGGFIGMAFPFMSEKRQLSVYLLTPASTFEKYLSQFLIRFVAASILFLIIFYIDAYVARQVALSVIEKYKIAATIDQFSYFKLFDDIPSYGEKIGMPSVILSLGFFLFCAKLYFNKAGLLKTILTGTALVFTFILLHVGFSHIFFPDTYGFRSELPTYKINDQFDNSEIWIIAVAWAIPLFFLPLGYFKLKEKQL